MPLIQLGLKPILVDCEIETLNVSLKKLKNVFETFPTISAFLITNALGHSDNIEKFRNFCREKDILFLEDNCESLGSKVKGKLLGNFGLASTFLFFCWSSPFYN